MTTSVFNKTFKDPIRYKTKVMSKEGETEFENRNTKGLNYIGEWTTTHIKGK